MTALLHLALADLRSSANVWLGSLLVSAAFGCVGGWSAALTQTAQAVGGSVSLMLSGAGSMVLFFSSAAAVVMLTSTTSAAVAARTRAYALWQVVNVLPHQVVLVLLAQAALVGLVGSGVGFALSAPTLDALFPVTLGTHPDLAGITLLPGWPQVGSTLSLATALSAFGAVRAARSAAGTSPVEALRDEQRVPRRSTGSVRLVALVVLLACVPLLVGVSGVAWGRGDTSLLTGLTLLFPLLLTAVAGVAAPILLPLLAGVWTELLPRRWTAAHLARRAVRHRLTSSTTVETPVMVAGALVTGLYALFSLLERFWHANNLPVGSGFDIEPWLAFLLFGGPVLVCSTGAAAGVVMSARQRGGEAVTLTALGATPRLCLEMAAAEAVIHATNATLVALACAVLSDLLVTTALGLPPSDALAALDPLPLLAVFAAGLALVLSTQLLAALASQHGELVPRVE